MKDLIVSPTLFPGGEKIMKTPPAMSRIGLDTGSSLEPRHVDAKRGRKLLVFSATLLTAAQVPLALPVAAQENAADFRMMQRMEALIREQQQQMERQQQQLAEQQKQLAEQQKQLDYLRQQLGELKTTTTESLTEAKDAKRAAEAAEKVTQSTASMDETFVHSGAGDPRDVGPAGPRAKLVVTGFVNRAVNIVDDGDDTDAYFVDNDNAESRVSFIGILDATDDLTLGTNIELTIAPNKASNVNQLDEETNNIFDQRKVELSLDSKRFGKVTLGKGDTASYHTGASDLSGTLVITTSTISDTAGGMLFRESGSGDLTDLRILQAYNAWDGLNRRNRLRYDSPSFHGFKVSGSFVSDNRHDLALRWGGQGNGFKAVAGAAIADPNEDGDDLNYNGSFSVLHERTGLNFAFSAGTRERDNQDNPYNLFGKLGWRKRLFPVGETAFSVDFTRSMNFPADNDEGYSFALAAVQNFDAYGTEIYALFRNHSLDRDVEPDVDDINVVSIGTRVKF